LQSRSRTRTFRPAVVSVIVVIAAGIGFAGLTLGPAQGAEGSTPVPSAAVSELSSAYGITLVNTDPSEPNPPISASTALANAQQAASFLGGSSPSTHLVYFTDAQYGIESSDADGAVPVPYSSNRLAWLVLFRHGAQPVMFGEEGAAFETETITAATFIDANSGEYIETVTLHDLESPR
jgi:hypothetical protein